MRVSDDMLILSFPFLASLLFSSFLFFRLSGEFLSGCVRLDIKDSLEFMEKDIASLVEMCYSLFRKVQPFALKKQNEMYPVSSG